MHKTRFWFLGTAIFAALFALAGAAAGYPTAPAGGGPTPAEIAVFPESLASNQLPNAVITQTLDIYNLGEETLSWVIEEDAGLRLPSAPSAEVASAGAPRAAPFAGFTLSANPRPAGAPSTPAAGARRTAGAITITHSLSQTITNGNSISCNAGGLHADNSYLRVFDLAAFGITGHFDVTSVDIGIEIALAGSGGVQPAEVRLYTLSGPFTFANLTLIGSASVNVADQSLTILTIPVAGTAPAGSILVVEFFTPDGQLAGHSLFVGSNAAGQTGPTYLAATACGVPEPTDTAALGFPNMHLVMNVTGSTPGTCIAPADIPWLSVLPAAGDTISGTSSTVEVTFDSTGYGTGVYTGTLCISSNDLVNPLVRVPVTLTVEAPSYGVALSGGLAQEGDGGSVVTYTVSVTNTGNAADIFALAISSTWTATLSSPSVSLASGAFTTFDVWVEVPAGAAGLSSEVAEVTASSQGDPGQSDTTTLTTTAALQTGLALSAAQAGSGHPGDSLVYTIYLTNTGNVLDVFDILATGVWTATPSMPAYLLAAGATGSFTVTVEIPEGCQRIKGASGSDVATVTVTSETDAATTASTSLTTTALGAYKAYIPAFVR